MLFHKDVKRKPKKTSKGLVKLDAPEVRVSESGIKIQSFCQIKPTNSYNWLVVEPTHLKNMLVNLDHFCR